MKKLLRVVSPIIPIILISLALVLVNALSLPITIQASSNVSATRTTVTASPLTVAADGMATTTITVTVRNSNNKALSGKIVRISARPASGVIIAPASATSGANGQAIFTARSTAAGTVTFTAVADGVTIQQKPVVTFVMPTPVPTATPVPSSTPLPTPVPSNTPLPTSVPSNTPVPTIIPSSTPLPPTPVPSFTPMPTITPSDVVPPTSSPTWTPTLPPYLPPSASKSLMHSYPVTVSADNMSLSTITVTVVDDAGNPLPGCTVQVYIDPSVPPATAAGVTIQPLSPITGADGKAKFQVRSSTSGNVTFRAIVGNTQLTATTSVFFLDPIWPTPTPYVDFGPGR